MMFGIKYKGLSIEVSRSAHFEMLKENVDLYDILEVLEYGFEPHRRKKDIVERCLTKGRKVIKAVVALNHRKDESYWTLIHVGRFTRK